MSAPAGWYPDANGNPRWWDGYRWVDAAPVAAPAGIPPRVAPGTSANTVWIWVIVLLPLVAAFVTSGYLLQMQNGMLDFVRIMPTDGSQPDPQAFIQWEMTTIFNGWYFALLGVGWLIYGISAWFAYLDFRELSRRGFVRPFHWAWIFLSSWVYVIGRTVVVGRRGGRGAAPLWVFIALQVAGFILAMIWMSMFMQQFMHAVMATVQTS